MTQPFLILATRSCRTYAKGVIAALNENPERLLYPDTIDYTDELSVAEFADGEIEVTLHKSVRGKTVFVFTTSARNAEGLTVEACKEELYHTIDVLKRSQAHEIIVFEPYISCSRSDRPIRRNSVGFWVHYKTLISLGTDHLITYQLHSDKSKTIFDPCSCAVDDVQALGLLQKYLCDTSIGSGEELDSRIRDEWLFCSVDAGGEKLARKFAVSFGTQLVVAHKQRNHDRVNEIECINILSAVPLEGKTVWIVDDMIDTAGSIFGLVRELYSKSGTPIHVMVVHPVLSGPACDRLATLRAEGCLGRLVTCDTVDCSKIKEKLPFIEIIESASMSARITLTISQERQMADLIDGFDPVTYLSGKR